MTVIPEENEVSTTPAVRTTGLRKRFGHREALRGIDLEVPASGCFVIFGPNGAGKSTLLRILSTRMRPSAGEVEILGMDPAREGTRVRASLGVVFHENCLRGELSLDENLRFYAELYGLRIPSIRDRLDGLTDKLGLFPRRHDPVRTYSQGMAKRATLIRSLIHNPRIWIIDEPFSGLDPSGCELLEGIIREEGSSGRAVILVTHDIETGLRLAGDGVAIVNGEVRARGRAEVEAYATSGRSGGDSSKPGAGPS